MKRIRYIMVNESPEKAARRAYKNGHYVEAIQILHAYLEHRARELVMLVGSVHFNAELKSTWDLTDTFSFQDCLKILFIMNQISNGEFTKFAELNSLRNKMIHQIYRDPYEKEHWGVLKRDYDRVFKQSLKMLEFFTEKSFLKSTL